MGSHVRVFFLLVSVCLGAQLCAGTFDFKVNPHKSWFSLSNIFGAINKPVEVTKKETSGIDLKAQFDFSFFKNKNSVNRPQFQFNYSPSFKSTYNFNKKNRFDNINKPVEVAKKKTAPSNFKRKICFKLFTIQNPMNGQELFINDPWSFQESYFDATKPTYIITHGWLNSENSPSVLLIRDAYLANTDSNVITIDWSADSTSLSYIGVIHRVKEIGGTVSEMISWLYSNGVQSDDVTLIAHSLGAHVMGIAGYKLEQKVKHIVGLDPAIHMYNFGGNSEMLSKQSAKHVQIIHTNAGGSGYMCPNGHSDFYPNGGSFQAGCCDYAKAPSLRNLKQALGGLVKCKSCSHGRAYEFFAESITRRFVATSCTSYLAFQHNACGANPRTALMGGLDLNAVTPGTYYLWTGPTRPYSEVRASYVPICPFLTSMLTTAACTVRSVLV